MKKFYLKRILSISLATVMTLNLAACGCGKKNTDNAVSDEEAKHDATAYVFKESPIDLGEGVDLSSINSMGSFGDKVYAVANNVGDDGNNVTTMYTFDKDGSNVATVNIDTTADCSVTNSAVASDGSIYTIETKYAGMIDGGISDASIEDLLGGGEDSFEVIEEPASEDNVTDDIDQYSAEESEDAAEADSVEATDNSDEDNSADAESSEADENTEKDTFEDNLNQISEAQSDSLGGTSEAAETTETVDGISSDTENMIISDDPAQANADTDVYYLVKHDASGAEIWKQELETKTDSYYYVSGFLLVDDSTILISDTLGVHKYNTADGTKTSDFDLADYADSDYGISVMIYKTGKGEVVGMIPGNEQSFYRLNLDEGTLSPVEGADNPFYELVFYPGAGDYDLFGVSTEGVYTYNLGDQNATMILNFVDSDINTYGLSQMVALSDTQIAALIPSDDAGYTLSILTKVDPKSVSERQQITLGCNYIDYDVRSQIIKFNKTNDNYRIVISDYSKFDSESDYSGGANRLNTDIVSGNTPDILVLDSDMPVDSYISKGLFEDLSDYFKNDEELSKLKFMDHVMETFKTDGKMYKLIPSYSIETVAAYTKDVGDKNTWTIDELEKIIKDKNIQYKNVFGNLSREDVFEMALSLSGSQYIDWSTLTCNYDSDAFIHLLEFVNEFPEELEEEDIYNDVSAYWREGNSIAERLYLYGLSDYNYEAKGTFGDKISLVGFPSDNGSGSALYPNLQLTMSSSSKVKDGCWEFMRYFLTDEYQKTIDGALPVSMTKMDEMIAAAKKKPTYIDENGKEVEYEDTTYIGETEIIISPMTDEEVNGVLDFINSVDQVGVANEEVVNIIYEEAAAFFSGQKTAAEVADIIQSRVQIYVNEIS
ncbi:extracellular solute-binding protein [Butyrivibrio sp. WCE2006]|uniref:extracellular solute-binding protein n=1 Tax=Butyrivibrio sp. WCE2006 TaxID=1410611 RepID=UPI0005D1DF9A|nr:extracellular solute-binding protein [Butyrivibrio sp. WCE2006]